MDPANTTENPRCYDVAILGAGYAGLMAALRLGRGRKPLRVVLINASDVFVERVRLQESIVNDVAPRIPSLLAFLAGTNVEFVCGEVTSLDAERRRIRLTCGGEEQEIGFGEVIYALGSRTDVEGVPGVAEHAYRLEAIEGARSPSALRSRLRENAGRPIRVITVGGAETSVEVAGEIKAAWPALEMMMITRSRVGGFKGARVEAAVRTELGRLGVTMIDHETITEVRSSEILTENGRRIRFDVCVWSGGLRAGPVAGRAGVATDPRGRVWVDANLRSISHPHVVAVGDAAHPLAPTGAPYRLSALVAIITGAYAADLILAGRAQRSLAPFSFSTFGQGIAIGHSGVGFASYPDDRQRWFILKGATARIVRNFFVWFILSALKIERRMPGFLFWPGRRRVSWQQANEAIRRSQAAQKVQAA
jgi:NADH dehydrogenase FAD-containing subunit